MKKEEEAGYEDMFTWFAKEKLIDILAKKMDRVKEGVETARDFSLKMEQMVGFSE